MPRAFRFALPVVLFLVLPAVPTPDASAASKAEEALVNKVLRKLLAEMEAPSGLDWPPQLVLEATDRPTAGSNVVRTPKGKNRPCITLSAALPRLVHGDEDVLAFVLGHELGHLALGHYRLAADAAANERRELEADVKAAELLLRAGYSLRNAARGLVRQKEMPSTHLPPASRKAASLSWDERFARLRSAPTLWKTLRAFENGVLLLALEQYEAAEVCFTRAADEFPGCHEAWVNLGIACLMQYADGFTGERLREEGIGQLVCGSFYRRGPRVRVSAEKLWWRAVGSLREALRLHPDLTLAKAYLGLAYLLHPGGKDVGEAARYLTEAAEDRSFNPRMHAALLVNLGVARLAAGAKDAGLGKLRDAVALGKPAAALVAAVNYNRAVVRAAAGGDERLQAVELFEKYLRAADPRSAWWPIAYDRYVELCRALGRTARTKAEFVKAAADRLRRRVTVALASGQAVAAGEAIEEVLERLGKHRTAVVLPRTNLNRYEFEPHGVNVLATEEVMVVVLRGPKAPPVKVCGRGPGGAFVAELRIGLTRRQVERLLGDEDALNQGHGYFLYRALGVAVRYDGTAADAQAIEMAIARPPEDGPLRR